MITSISIRNFKSLKECSINLNRINILYGLNAMGKSALIQSFTLIKQSIRSGAFNNDHISLNGELVKLGVSSDVFSVNADDRDEIQFSFNTDLGNCDIILDCSPQYSNSNYLPILYCSNKALFYKQFEQLSYISSQRISPSTISLASEYDIHSNNSIGISGEFGVHFLAINKRTPISASRKHPQASTLELLENCEHWMRSISPNINISAKTDYDLNVASLRYSFSDERNRTKEFKPTNVGFGITHVLPIIIKLLIVKEDSLLIIENPEPHIHPRGLEELTKLIYVVSKDKVQIIIESHSNEIINCLFSHCNERDSSISLCYFYRDHLEFKTNVTIHSFNSIPEGVNLLDFLSTYQINQNKLIEKIKQQTRTTVITEGKTDWKILKFVLEFYKANNRFIDLEIDFLEFEDGNMGHADLTKLKLRFASYSNPNKTIFLYDRDSYPYLDDEFEYKHEGESTYVAVIPIPSFRKGNKNISIELLFPNKVLLSENNEHRRIFLTSEFNRFGKHNSNTNIYIYGNEINPNELQETNEKLLSDKCKVFKNDVSLKLSKIDFVNAILNEEIKFTMDDLGAFESLFKTIEKISR